MLIICPPNRKGNDFSCFSREKIVYLIKIYLMAVPNSSSTRAATQGEVPEENFMKNPFAPQSWMT